VPGSDSEFSRFGASRSRLKFLSWVVLPDGAVRPMGSSTLPTNRFVGLYRNVKREGRKDLCLD